MKAIIKVVRSIRKAMSANKNNQIRIKIEKKIHSGAEGSVYNCVLDPERGVTRVILLPNAKVNDPTVCKQYHLSKKEGYDNEKDILKKISMEYIVPLYGYNDTTRVLLLKKCDMDLFDFISGRTITTVEFWTIARQLLCAIQHLHKNKIAHTDIKLDNIGINQDLSIRLLDFGHALTDADKCFMTPVHKLMGSMHYTAPEVSWGCGFVDEVYPIDYWELGVVCFSLLNKTFPFRGKNPASQSYQDEVAFSIRSQTPEWEPQVDKQCVQFVNKLLKKDSCDRFKLGADEDVDSVINQFKFPLLNDSRAATMTLFSKFDSM